MKALIVDDKLENLYLLQTMFQAKGYETVTAANGQEALDKLQAEPFDLIIADILMPVMDGFQLCKHCKGNEALRNIPFIFYTATYVDDKDETFALKLGADRFLRKPMQPNDFLKAVQAVMEEAEARGLEPGQPAQRAEEETYKLYSQRLVQKLEKKMQDLEAELARRKEAEREIRKLSAAVEQSPNIVMITDGEGNIEYVNPKFEQITGYTAAEILGRKAMELGEQSEKEAEEMLEALLSGREWRGMFSNRKKNDKFYWEQASISPMFAEDGSITHFVKVAEDVTEKIDMEEALKKSEERLTFALEASNDGLWDWNVRTGEVYFSPRYFTMLGYTPYELPQSYETWAGLLHPEDRAGVEAGILEHIAQKSEPFEKEFRLETKSGHWKWILGRGKVFSYDEQGKAVRVVGTHTDISSLKKAEQLLQESEARYRNLIEVSPVGICVHAGGRVVFSNQAGAEIIGAASPEELMGKPIKEIIHPDNWDAARDRIRRMLAGETGLYPVEDRYVRLDGQAIDVEVMATALSYEGQPAVQVMVQDISRRKDMERSLRQSRQEYQDIFYSITDIFYRTDAKGRITVISPSVRDILGYAPEEVLGEQMSRFYRIPEQREDLLAALQETGELKDFQAEMPARDGSLVWVSTNAALRKDALGKVLGVQGLARDITDWKMAEQEKQDLEVKLLQAQKMEAIGTLAGGIAHDFNNILTAIIGTAQLAAAEAKPGSPVHRDLHEILKAGNRAADLVQRILAFSRKQKGDKEPVELQALVKESVKMLQATLSAGIEIRREIQGNLPLVSGDPSQLHQVLMNLCTNAAQAMAETGGVLEIGLSVTDLDAGFTKRDADMEPGEYLRLTVSDTGPGMSPEVRQRIFEPFFTTKDKHKGTGLGLSTAYGIVKEHGGMISVYSEPGRGSTFRVYLPALEAEEGPRSKPEASLQAGTERILLVDDEPSIVRIGRRMLEGLGYRVEARTGSLEALEVFAADPEAFDLVITDMDMPQMTGEDLTLRLLAIRPDLPVIICTGFSERITRENLKEKGIRAVLMKPFQREGIAGKVREVLDGREEVPQVDK
ncbi:MAG: PAS domain S-box protein [Desulfohalobiaceae bacterium]|nr:PAS domain S-box protein [Desulfohalobiaceae bacterium]